MTIRPSPTDEDRVFLLGTPGSYFGMAVHPPTFLSIRVFTAVSPKNSRFSIPLLHSFHGNQKGASRFFSYLRPLCGFPPGTGLSPSHLFRSFFFPRSSLLNPTSLASFLVFISSKKKDHKALPQSPFCMCLRMLVYTSFRRRLSSRTAQSFCVDRWPNPLLLILTFLHLVSSPHLLLGRFGGYSSPPPTVCSAPSIGFALLLEFDWHPYCPYMHVGLAHPPLPSPLPPVPSILQSPACALNRHEVMRFFKSDGFFSTTAPLIPPLPGVYPGLVQLDSDPGASLRCAIAPSTFYSPPIVGSGPGTFYLFFVKTPLLGSCCEPLLPPR